MKITFCLLLFISIAHAQSYTREEKRLMDENKMLREEIQKLKSAQGTTQQNINAPTPTTQDSSKIMESLQQARKRQEEANQILQDLEKDEE